MPWLIAAADTKPVIEALTLIKAAIGGQAELSTKYFYGNQQLMGKVVLYLGIFLMLLAARPGLSQSCPVNSLGQNPFTAFPVCGSSTFIQASVNLCGGTQIPNPNCNTNPLTDVNPYWYKFTCFEPGTLGFVIQPNSNVSDYDWQVFDITGHDPNDVYTNPRLTICSNWSQYFGNTGTSTGASNVFECEGTVPQYSKPPILVKGHQYLLLVSHFTDSQAGYKLMFKGGTASITDTTPPHVKALYASCIASKLGVKLNKKMICKTLASNGSDFSLSPAVASITGATSFSCSSGFDLDSIVLTLDKPLPAGKYTLHVKQGSDGNTLLDYCDNPLPVTDSLTIDILPMMPTPMDSIEAETCQPTGVNLVFKTAIDCSSIARNGSDFTVTGPTAVTVTGASANCSADLSRNIRVEFSGPVQVGGVYTITLQKGTDGNTIINECSLETPAGAFLQFRCFDTVSAAINYEVTSSCTDDTLKLWNDGVININSWKWTFDDGSATKQSIEHVYSSGTRTVGLVVSNGGCTDSASLTISFDKNRLHALFNAPRFVCPLDTAFFADSSSGPVTGWLWDFGNGVTSSLQTPPPQFFPVNTALMEYTVLLTVSSDNGCFDTAQRVIIVPGNCYIAVPSAFTPNGDGLNDFLYPLNAYKAVNLDFKVYNRYGQLIWHTADWTKKWDGRINGALQASGAYVWHLTYYDPDKKKDIDLKGTTTLIR